MAYDPSDPRTALAAASAPRKAAANVAPQYFEFGERAPGEKTPGGSQLWWARSQACIVNYVRAAAGDRFDRTGQRDEYAVLVTTDGAPVTFTDASGATTVDRTAVVVMPPGDTTIEAGADTDIVRIFSTQSPDLCARCDNDDFYATADPNVPPFAPWPDPPAGHRIRVYPIADVPDQPGRFGRIFRCSTLMINYLNHNDGPRDPSKMSPHHHDDFEQLSLQLSGEYVHHIRTPWTPDMAEWRDDEHQFCSSPSVTVIPPPSVHTSQAVGAGRNQLIDIFAPPRFDFSAQPGWVLNADEYPMPTA
jgi:hypothetical protein